VEKVAKTVSQTFFCQNQYITFTVEKVAKNMGYFCSFQKASKRQIRSIWSPWRQPKDKNKMTKMVLH
jgi:hypothetical protein